MNTISTIQTEQKFLQQFSSLGFPGIKQCANDDIQCSAEKLQRTENFSGMFSTTYCSSLPRHLKDNTTVRITYFTLFKYCEYVEDTPLVSILIIFPVVSSLVINSSGASPDDSSFGGIRRATHIRHRMPSDDSEVMPSPSAFSLGYVRNVEAIWKKHHSISSNSQWIKDKIKTNTPVF